MFIEDQFCSSETTFSWIFWDDRHNFGFFYKLDVVDGIQFLAFELKFLYWYHYPLKSMPENFSPEKLAKLDLCFCSSLTKLTSNSHSPNFSDLNLQDYMNLREFLLISDNMKVLKLQWTKVKALSSSFEHHRKLKWLHLKGSHFERLPSLINNLIQQQHLHAISCRELQTIPELPLFIETLYADSCTSLQTLLEFPPSLKTLNIKKCRSLQTLPEILLFLETLDVAYGTSLKTLLGLPPFLKTQNTGECKSLQSLTELPLFLKTLSTTSCISLKTLANLPPLLETLDTEGYTSLWTLPELPLLLKTLNIWMRITSDSTRASPFPWKSIYLTLHITSDSTRASLVPWNSKCHVLQIIEYCVVSFNGCWTVKGKQEINSVLELVELEWTFFGGIWVECANKCDEICEPTPIYAYNWILCCPLLCVVLQVSGLSYWSGSCYVSCGADIAIRIFHVLIFTD